MDMQHAEAVPFDGRLDVCRCLVERLAAADDVVHGIPPVSVAARFDRDLLLHPSCLRVSCRNHGRCRQPMARKYIQGRSGRVVILEHVSRILKNNRLDDPHVRKLAVWLPPAYDGSGNRRFPVLYDFAGYTGSGLAHLNWKPFSENLVERAARLIHDRKMPPVILVMPDCFTALGGNQYLNSPAIGRYADYLTREIVPFVDAEFRTLAAREHRGCF
ncbi:MAG: hypothetical protein FJ170_09220, partial [Gammaproteobacteria bacterium]|nr:hypothetical protein [Gammaproteobacteria bacterium]